MGSFIDIIIFAAIAAYIFLKLRNVLGSQDEEQKNSIMERASRDNPYVKDVTPTRKVEVEHYSLSDLSVQDQETLAKIKEADPEFTLSTFTDGAKKAFEIIIDALNRNDYENIEDLVSSEVQATFTEAYDNLRATHRMQEITIVSIQEAKVTSIGFDNKSVARITVLFISEQMHIIKNTLTKEVAEETPSQIIKVKDIWTFERQLPSDNPSWVLVNIGE